MENDGRDGYISDERLAEYAASTAMLEDCTGHMTGSEAARRVRADMRAVDRAHDLLRARYEKAEHMPAACEWLLDNRYIARRESECAASALSAAKRLRRIEGGALLLDLCLVLVNAGKGEVTAERCEIFLRGYQSVRSLTQEELALFPAALRGALTAKLRSECALLCSGGRPEELEGTVSAVFTSLRLIASIDLSSVLDSVSAVEQALRRDPAGTYPAMDEESRAAYRAAVTALAKKNGMDERSAAEEILRLAENSQGGQRHVGFWLFTRPMGRPKKERRGALYISANILLTLFLSLLFGFAERSAAAALLLLLPVSELVKSLIDFVVGRAVKPVRLPGLALEDGVPKSGAALCVVSALLTGPDSGRRAAAKLERFRLLSRDCGPELRFGILADLRESVRAEEDADGEILSAAARAVDELNRRYGGGFYLFARDRKYCRADRVFRGWERKRGAVMQLASLLRGGESELRVLSGDLSALPGTKYILTVDSDTELLPGSARKLIGAMLHPLNRPAVENGVVKTGHGLIQPRISVELGSAAATDFSRVYAGQGGIDPYSPLCGELYMDMFGRGGFAGKGIIDVDALLSCCAGRFPENRVLSHDALEGAFLRGGYLGDCEVTDGFPGKALSFFRRLGRWTRGDWQNAPWIFSAGRQLSDIDRFKLFDSLRRSLVPPLTFAAIFLGFFMPESGLATAAAAALLALLSNLFLSLADSAMRGGDGRVRFHSAVVHGVGGAIMLTFFRLWLLPAEAWTCLSSIARSLWRMAVSHRKLLQWETAAQSDLDPGGLWANIIYMWFSAAAGLVCLLLSVSVIGRTAGLIWLTAPACAWALSLPAGKERRPTGREKRYLTDCAARIWKFFDDFCAEEDNFLPPDNFQEQPPVGLAHRTSPTNIGLALVSCLAASELGVDERLTAMSHIEKMLETVSRLPKWRGHLYNWYDTRTLRPLEPAGVSTVDSGNLCASLIALREWLRERGRNDLADAADALCSGMDFTPLYDASRRLMYIGWDARRDRPYAGWYDLMASEARLTSYIAAARGQADERHWRRLSRAEFQLDGYRGLASWTGTMFEYLMPELFLPLRRDSLFYESARFCLYAQKRRVGEGTPWGISESAFFALDPALNYRYKASGCAALAIKRGQDDDLVVSPYSSFLALCAEPAAAVRNLRRLEKRGAACEYGFFEAVDYTPSRCRGGDGELVRCVMAHHQGMSMAAIANFLCGGAVTGRFMRDPAMAAYGCLLCERVPTGGPLLRRGGSSIPGKPERPACEKWEVRGEGSDFDNPRCCLLSNGVYSIMSTEYGQTVSLCRDMLVYAPSDATGAGHGTELRLMTDGGEFSLLPEPGAGGEILWELSEDSAYVQTENELYLSRCTVAAAGGLAGEIRLVRIEAKQALAGTAELSFVPALAPGDDYRGHPAFWRLGMEAKNYGGTLLLRALRRNNRPETWLCLACGGEAEFSADAGGGVGWLSHPLVRCRTKVTLKAGESVQLRFSLCLGRTADEAYNGAQRLTALGPADYANMPAACAALSGMDAREMGLAMELVRPVWFPRPAGMCAREKLWRYSLSGDLPIITLAPGCADDVEGPIRRFCLLRCCGALCDLAIITDDGGQYERPVSRRVEDVLEKMGLGSMLGSYGGVHLLPYGALDTVKTCACCLIGGGTPQRRTDSPVIPYAPERTDTEIPDCSFDNDCFSFYVNRKLPPRCWTDVLCSGDFGFIAADSGCGNMWFQNAREQPINSWINDPLAVSGPETLEIETGGGRYSLFAAADGFPCRVIFGFGRASWEKDFGTFKSRVTACVPPEADARILTIEFDGRPEGRILWKTSLRLCSDADGRGGISINYVNSIFTVESTRSYTDGLRFSAAFSSPPAAFTCSGLKWRRGELNCSSETDGEPVLGAAFSPAQPLIISCGCGKEESIQELCKSECAENSMVGTAEHWSALLGRFHVDGLGGAMEHMVNGWAGYQAICCRLLARTSLYQSGGAYGFRDQLQDAVNVILLDSRPAREQILLACRHQYTQGDVMHWWHPHPDGDRGVRTRCSDDLLWLVWALCEYAEKTGDLSVCRERAPYLVSPVLSDDERDRYETPAVSESDDTVLSHALRAADLCLSRGTGPHGLLKFGSGDWNDGMDRVGGESVWLTWFFSHTTARLAELLKLCKLDYVKYSDASDALGRAADAAWDGGWYLRGYWPDGEPLGSRKCRCCELDSVAQSWAAMCSSASPEKTDAALDAAVSRLFDRKNKLVKLFDPPFSDCGRSPGYIESYGPGFRENGGQYTHGAIWLAMACLRRGRTDDGRAILEALLPENHDIILQSLIQFNFPFDILQLAG